MLPAEERLFPPYLCKGSRGDAVKVLQVLLLSFLSSFRNRLIVDGDYGDVTAQAVYEFQEALSIPATGNFDPLTRSTFARISKINLDIIPKMTGATEAVIPQEE